MKPPYEYYNKVKDSYNEFLPDFQGEFPIDIAGKNV